MSQSPAGAPAASISARHVAAVTVGNGLEFYDFLTFSIFAVYIGRAFFPGQNPTEQLFASLATFWAGFLTRPVGAMVLGPLGDKIGRKPAMLISFVLMGAGMLGLAVTPTYRQIGIAAPILAVAFRLIQGFALGGNVGPTTAYMVEAAPPERRGYYGAFQYASQNAAVLVSALVGFGLSRVLSPADLQAWGWRLAFILGVTIVPFGLWLRGAMPETLPPAGLPEAPDGPSRFPRRGGPPIAPHARLIVCGFLLLVSGTIVTYVTIYMTTYAIDTLHMRPDAAFGIDALTAFLGIPLCSAAGWLSDKIGRKPVMIWPAIAAILITPPAFWAITRHPGVLTLYTGMGLLASLAAIASAPVIIALTEGLPAAIRSGGVAIIYAFAISIFGGATQLVLAKAIHATGDPMAPAWFLIGALLVGLPAMFAVRESAPAVLAARSRRLATTLAAAPST